ncbi:MAG: phenylalanine--tRNA ligase subunit alpha [Actinomycetota bacterium]|nr:phenylalanine--tRNA ligase subunit alpha [Actinomycetota bacterium]
MNIEDTSAQLASITSEAQEAIAAAASLSEMEELRVKFLGRKSPIAQINQGMGKLDEQQRRTVGRELTEARRTIDAAFAAKTQVLEAAEQTARLDAEQLDVTLPGRRLRRGVIHPLTQVIDDIVDAFVGIGFNVIEGPIVETDYYNFEALNIPNDHPARSMHDTIYVESDDPGSIVLRTHTSPMQIRLMEKTEPPLYVLIPGRVVRNEEVDANHLASFMQIEGLAVDEGLSMADLKGTLEVFARTMFGKDQQVRMHPSYFPFTEPSAEVYVVCFDCNGKGCATCKDEGWIEILGAGMVHPHVLQRVGYDSERYTGFAFGLGVERVAKLRYEIPNLRWFYENDIASLGSFS